MPSFRSIRVRRSRRRVQKDSELPLTSMMDVLVIIVVFLLKTYAASTSSFTTVEGIRIPMSGSLDQPQDSLQVIVTPSAMYLDDERILDFAKSAESTEEDNYEFKGFDLDEGGRRIVPLYDALIKAKEKSENLRIQSQARDDKGNPLPFEGILAIQADKRIQYDTIRKVMYTAAAAEYRLFRFLAQQKEQ